jgi:hypothetical protein
VLGALAGRSLSVAADVLVMDLMMNPTLVFLKQFRDATCPSKACYQSVLEAPISLQLGDASYAVLDQTEFSVTVQNWASHPVATDLGLPASRALTPLRAFEARLGFDVQTGIEVWRAPT